MKGVVLDFDGVICKSMELHAEAYRRVLAPYGIELRDEDVFLREGARSETIIRDFLGDAGRPQAESSIRALAEEKQRIYASLGPPPLYAGAEEMVRRIREGVPRLALVTGTRKENVARLIPQLVPWFDAILAQDAYHHDKPHPEPYLKSAAAVGLEPQNCAALENAVRGVQSARAAGYGQVVAVTTTMPRDVLLRAGAGVVAPSHSGAAGAILQWIGG